MTTDNKALTWGSVEGYLASIGMVSDFDIELVKKIFHQGKEICPEELQTIFISNYEEPTGKEQFKDLWLFSDNYIIEVINFRKQEALKYEMGIFNKNIQGVSIDTTNINLSRKAKDDSSLHITFYTYGDFTVDQISIGPNCDYLLSIYKKYVKPNLVRG